MPRPPRLPVAVRPAPALASAFASASAVGAAGLALAFLLAATACSGSDVRLARRILDDHRRATHARPQPISQVVEIRLSAPRTAARGTLQIEWDARRYRETASSAGATTIRGIQAGKAFFTDEDGVTRVVSEPVLAELLTRSYFFRRAYLFDDAERARISLGPADDAHVSIELLPHEGNPLRLTFDRRTLRLAAASSRGLDLAFDAASPARWRDTSSPGAPLDAEVLHSGLPSDSLPDAAVGGWSANWPSASVQAPLVEVDAGPGAPPGSAVVVRGTLAGRPVSIAVDAAVRGPVRVRRELAARLGLAFSPDVFGRTIAPGAKLEIAGWNEPSVHVEASDEIPSGADASAGAALFREAVVEYDAPAKRLNLHDPGKWVRGEGYYRCIMDDDGDEPVAVLQRHGERARVTAGAAAAIPLALLPAARERLRLPEGAKEAEGLFWGPAPLPVLDLQPLSGEDAARFSAAHRDVEGRLSAAFLLRFRAVLDMPHRWAYLRPESGPTPRPD
jgi:hypothetical protein